MATNDILLDVKNLSVDFTLRGDVFPVVKSVSLQLNQTETLGVVGESGSGKSITSLAIMGLIQMPGNVSSGSARFMGKDLLRLTDNERRKRLGKDISMIFQDPTESLNPVQRVGQQIEESLKIHTGLTRSQRKKRVLELLIMVGLPDPDSVRKKWPQQLSGGMNQRVMIAMALACNPRVLIADEPTTALDVTVQKQILQLLKKLQKQNKMGMIFISHDLSVVSMMADRIIVMYAGQVVENCAASRLFNQAAHPYTRALLESLPEAKSKANRLQGIKGSPPVAGDMLTGCSFEPRCKFAKAQCRQKQPELQLFNKNHDHSLRCFFPLSNVELAGRE